MNTIQIHGRLVKQPDKRVTTKGISVCAFTVAVDRKFTPQGQEKQTDFFDVVAWKGAADVICQYFKKGSEIIVSGRMEQRKWQDKEGNNRYSWEIQMQDFDFCGSKKTSRSDGFEECDATDIDIF